jgi:amino acid adenylation domain-containing protein
VDIVFLDESQLSMREESRANPVIEASGDNVAYLLYTSGSTGHPKGVLVPRSSLTEYAVAFADAIQIRPSDRILQFASIGFDVSLEEIVPAWISGATIVLPRSENVALTEDLLHVLATQEVTIVELPTAFWTAWIENLESRGRSLPDSLRLVIVGGERVLTRSAVTWTREFGVPLANVYGLTEATITSTLYHVPCDLTELMGFDTLPIGWPLSNTTVYLLDQHLNSVRADEVGEVYVGGTGVGRCFLNEPRLTAEAFIPDPYTVQAGARMYKTGDLARHGVDGAIHFIGRVDTQVKVRGYRVELSEVEKVLALHPAVGDCMVRLDSDGKTDTTLVAYWTPRKSCKDTVRCEELGAWLLGKLPEYMVPTRFVVLDSLPLTDRGKVDRRKTFSSACDIGGRDSGLPVNRVEDLVITVFSEVLNVGGIDALDSFFELGGHSLSAIKIVSRLQERLGIELPVRMIFEAPKIRNLAAQITERLDRVPQDASDLPATSHTDVAAQTTANTRENSV